MKTVDKAMRLLATFSVEQSEIGLSELARMAEIDKAATRRLLVALGEYGFIEQNEETRQYRLGSGFLRLAHIRETSFPINRVSREIAAWLSAETGESAHISVPDSGSLRTIAHHEPNRGTIVHLDPSELLPLHATSSGIVFLGFSSEAERKDFLSKPLKAYTSCTITDPEKIEALANQAFASGFASSVNGFEDHAAGIAVPFFGQSETVEGTVAIAAPSSRMNDEKRASTLRLLHQASACLTRALGGTMPDNMPVTDNE